MVKAVPAAYVSNYDKVLTKLTDKACAELKPMLLRVDYSDIAQARDTVIGILDTYLSAYTDAAASISASFYKACRDFVLGGDYAPISESGRNPKATGESIRAFIQTIVDGDGVDSFVDKVMRRVDYEIRKAAAECMFANAEYDPF